MSVGDKWSGVYGSADGEAFRRTLDEAFEVSGAVSNVGEWVSLLGWLDVQGFRRRMKRLSKMYDRFLEQILHEHEASMAAAGDGGQPAAAACDLVDVLLQLSGEEEEGSAGAGADSEARLTRDGVKAFILDIIAGGTESSAVAMEWAMAELLRRPDAMAAATDELDRVVGTARWVTERDIPDLPYVDAVVKEALRLHPVGPLLVPHHAMEDTVVAGGYVVPAGARVLVNAWAIGGDPASGPDRPDAFLPERFLPGRRRRSRRIGRARAALRAAAVRGFAWRLPDGVAAEDVSMEELVGLSTRRKVPLVAVAEPRLPAHLYAGTAA
ncbi:hypothetical protein OsJ_11919 [Oryza sativa Japonica Group]|uniref:Uncharacterized protein n=1 Tax=Oryza sativa subsp. japonica TaxID=39947 RepID=B9FA24_ORYSJ|nr:hypothetical protein OsJ_11919 [Oryza sativa Japonica Group]